MLPNIHKKQWLNEIIAQNPLEYVAVSTMLDIEGQAIVVRSTYPTRGISILIK